MRNVYHQGINVSAQQKLLLRGAFLGNIARHVLGGESSVVDPESTEGTSSMSSSTVTLHRMPHPHVTCGAT